MENEIIIPGIIIPGTPFTQEEDEMLIRLLGKVKRHGCRWPTEASMRAGHGVVSYWAPELVILRHGMMSKDLEILLTFYEGGIEEFRGIWCLPGGYNIWNEPDIQATVSRVALREVGVDAKYIKSLHDQKWPPGEHPYGAPLSVFTLCEPTALIQETEKLRFFRVGELPRPMVRIHRTFINNIRQGV